MRQSLLYARFLFTNSLIVMKVESVNQFKRDKREWTIISLFRQSYPLFPIGELHKSECPDFIIDTTSRAGRPRRIGIELTELKYERNDQKFNMRAHEDFLSRIMDAALLCFQRSQDLILNVDVHFSDSLSPLILASPDDSEAHLLSAALAETIAQIVIDNIPESTGKRYEVDRRYKYGDINLPQHVESIAITNVTGRQEEPLWYASMSTHVKPISVASISQRIKDKDAKISHYDASCDEIWLVIIQNSFLMSRAYDPVAARRALQHRYPSRFNRVFVFERSEASVSTLRLIKKQH